MSTRYAWKVYNKSSQRVETETAVSSVEFYDNTVGQTTRHILMVGTGYTFNASNGSFTLTGDTDVVDCYGTISAKTYPYAIPYRSSGTYTELFAYKGSSTGYWYVYQQGSSSNSYGGVKILADSSAPNGTTRLFYNKEIGTEDIQGSTLKGTVTSASSGAYPTNGVGTASGTTSNWYVYQGSDSIDPTAVSYSNTQPRGGDTITVTVTPRANTYGGTIYYLYQYSTDGGSSWTTSGSKTTAASKDFTIPKTAQQFMVRVLASDDLGFTSTTYVSGANLTVANVQAYLGINDKARKAKTIYIGVSDKARKVTAGYVGVNNKARSWF